MVQHGNYRFCGQESSKFSNDGSSRSLFSLSLLATLLGNDLARHATIPNARLSSKNTMNILNTTLATAGTHRTNSLMTSLLTIYRTLPFFSRHGLFVQEFACAASWFKSGWA